ncbi:hypothetical protein HYPSUDRAFT_218811 [Hypholoma sublateritium FD-334 SS-4]|uniref:Uncharacterized protein n=1 Tax=Hypholoma sublateritium (strain FD-334 SS-4) TaxID=945553 RepID=A0A0D2NEK9_HYPSF|nr:hypothetical protein HYPSUDRAFT_218811 [Hypholoma sublateritium FD-334 SS-4]
MTTSVDRPKNAAIDDRTRTPFAQDPGVDALAVPTHAGHVISTLAVGSPALSALSSPRMPLNTLSRSPRTPRRRAVQQPAKPPALRSPYQSQTPLLPRARCAPASPSSASPINATPFALGSHAATQGRRPRSLRTQKCPALQLFPVSAAAHDAFCTRDPGSLYVWP